MPLAHRVVDDEKFAMVVLPARPVRWGDGSGAAAPPSPRFLVAMIRGPFTRHELDAFLDDPWPLTRHELAAFLASHFGPRVIVETYGITMGLLMGEADGRLVHATIEPFAPRRLIDGYSFYLGRHYINQMLNAPFSEQQGWRRWINTENAAAARGLHQPGGGLRRSVSCPADMSPMGTERFEAKMRPFTRHELDAFLDDPG